nr:MAG TPA: hypothetical protein [Caudoviricetes sp.]
MIIPLYFYGGLYEKITCWLMSFACFCCCE